MTVLDTSKKNFTLGIWLLALQLPETSIQDIIFLSSHGNDTTSRKMEWLVDKSCCSRQSECQNVENTDSSISLRNNADRYVNAENVFTVQFFLS